jgi:hypothetical protein
MTVALSVVPAVVDGGRPVSNKAPAGPAITWVERNPVIDGFSVSVAVTFCGPAVPNCTVTTFVPRSAGVKVVSGIGVA